MSDETETIRRQMVAEINADPAAGWTWSPSMVKSGTPDNFKMTSRLLASLLRSSSCVGSRIASGARSCSRTRLGSITVSAPSRANEEAVGSLGTVPWWTSPFIIDDEPRSSLLQKKFLRNSSGKLDRGGTLCGTLDNTVPPLLYLPLVAFPETGKPWRFSVRLNFLPDSHPEKSQRKKRHYGEGFSVDCPTPVFAVARNIPEARLHRRREERWWRARGTGVRRKACPCPSEL